MLIARENTERIPPLAEGMYEAVCTMLIDMGTQSNPRFGNSSRKVRIVWNIIGQTVKFGEKEVPRQLSREFTNSLSDKSNLRKSLQSWRGKAFTPEELKGFDLKKILGVGAIIQVMHKSGENGEYAIIETIIPFTQGKRPPQVSPVLFDLDDENTYSIFQTLPRYIQEEISKSEEFSMTGLQVAPKNNARQVPPPDDSYAPPVDDRYAPPLEYGEFQQIPYDEASSF